MTEIKWTIVAAAVLVIAFLTTGVGNKTPMSTGAEPVSPNLTNLSSQLEQGVRVFRLSAEPVQQEIAPGVTITAWGYNGSTPGPTIISRAGERVRIVVTNNLPQPTSVHWHGIVVPNAMDGVPGVTQDPIAPGDSFTYEFTPARAGTFAYHSHYNVAVQENMGLVGIFIVLPTGTVDAVDRDYALLLQEWSVPAGSTVPNPMSDSFNYFTINGVAYPLTQALEVTQGQRVRIRLLDFSMQSHPMHLHGQDFQIESRGGPPLPVSARWWDNTVNVAPGQITNLVFKAENLGDWVFHCHIPHHTTNGMQMKELEAGDTPMAPPDLPLGGMLTVLQVKE